VQAVTDHPIPFGQGWYVDETYIKVHGQRRYLYRAIVRNGALVDVMFSKHRDMAAAKAFFGSAKAVTGVTPKRVTTDGHDSYPRAIRSELGQDVLHRDNAYLNNRLEQDHRGIKDRYQPMRGFKRPHSAGRFCRGYDELHNFLLSRSPAPSTCFSRPSPVSLSSSHRDRAEPAAGRMIKLASHTPQALQAGVFSDRTPQACGYI
jgi:transposase-like protein